MKKNIWDLKNNKKIIVLFVCLLFVATVIPAAGVKEKNDTNQSHTGIEDNTGCNCGDFTDIDEQKSNHLPNCTVMTIPLKRSDPDGASPKPQIINTPDEFSWKDVDGEDWTTPAKSQGQCGSCWDFAALGTLEGIINVREGFASLDPDLSEQYVLSCLPSAGDCGGGSSTRAFRYIMETTPEGNYHNGVIFESCFPYQADDTIPCSDKCDDWEDQLVPLLDYGYWFPNGSPQDREAIKSQLMEDGPLCGHIMATDDFKEWGLTHHSPEDYYPYHYGDWPNHCIVLVGWKDDPSITHGGYWIFKNSWGTFWGYDGFFNIEYGSLCIDNWEIDWVDYDPEGFNWPPVVNTGGPYYANIGQDIAFDASRSFDPEGIITSYYWDFGDETTDTGVAPTHAYTERGAYTITLTVTDENEQESTGETVALVDIWMNKDKWTFNIDEININLSQEGQSFKLHASIGKLALTVAEDSSDYFQLDFNGKIAGTFDANIISDGSPMQFSGRILKFTTIYGNILFRKTDLGIKEIDAHIIGMLLIENHPFPIPIPLPAPGRIALKIDFGSPYTFLDFPFHVGKESDFPLTSASVEATVKSICLFIMHLVEPSIPNSILFEETFSLPALPYVCVDKREITVEAGTYTAYEISSGEFLTYYYAPAVGNIIKFSAQLEDVLNMHGELTSTNYNK